VAYHLCLCPIPSPPFDGQCICPLVLVLGSRDLMNMCLLRIHVEMFYGEAIGIFFVLPDLALCLVLSLDLDHDVGRLCLLLNPKECILALFNSIALQLT
jgi:hypothetical protein